MNFGKIYFSAILFICSCGAGTNDRYEELSGGYYYVGESSTKRLIKHERAFKIPLVIHSVVRDFVFDDHFILAEQHPNYKSHREELASYIYDYHDKFEIFEERADSILKHDKQYEKIFKHSVNYWIIKVDVDSLLGPLTLEEYKHLRKKLNVPESLKLEVEK